MIEIKNVTKVFNDNLKVEALSNISFDLPDKGFVALSGENGCGKTTLLNIISTIDNDYMGEVFIDNLNIKDNAEIMRKEYISYVFQEKFFSNDLTIYENLSLYTDDLNLIDEYLLKLNIIDKKDSYINDLSGGQKQRASFIKGILKESEIFIVDEPTSSMDEETEKYIFNLLSHVSKRKLVILVSHNHTLIKEYCDIIIKLNEGKIESILDNKHSNNYKIKDNVIEIPNNFNLSNIGENVDNIISNYGEVIIKRNDLLDKDENIDSNLLNENINLNLANTYDKNKNKVIFKTFLKKIKGSILFITLFSLLVLISNIMFDFNMFDNNKFIYKTLDGNDEVLVNALFDNGYTDLSISNDELYEYSKVNDIRFDFVYESFSANYEYSDAIFSNIIMGINYSNFINVSFAEGDYKNNLDYYVITDYVADALIKEEIYDSYSYIIENGIYVDDIHVNISAIMDTDYEKYFEKELSTKDNHNYLKNIQYIYTPLYSYVNNSNKTMSLEFVNSEFFNTNVIKSNEFNIKNDYCVINQSFANKIKYDYKDDFYFKYEGGYLLVSKVINDSSNYPNLYINSEQFDQMLDEKIEYIRRYNIEVNSPLICEYFSDKSIFYNSYSAMYVYDTIDIVNAIKLLFFIIFIIVISISLLLVYKYVKARLDQNKILYVNYLMLGYPKDKYYKNEILFMIIIFGINLLFNVIFYFLGYNLLNFILTKIFGANISIFINSFLGFFLTSLILIFLYALSYLIYYLKRRKLNLVEIVKNNIK